MDRTRNKFLARSGFPGDQHGGVCGSNLRHMREYFLQGARTSDDLVAHRSLIDFIGQGDALVFESLFRLLWIRHEYCPASHELPPDLESLRLLRSLCSLRALWSLSRLRTTPNGVADSQLVRGAPSAYIKVGRRTLLGDRKLTCGGSRTARLPPIISGMAAARRRTRSPAPGQPPGNIVNNRCKFSPYFAVISHSYEANVTG